MTLELTKQFDNRVEYWKRPSNAPSFLHRENGPAIHYHCGAGEWYLNGERHREDGPAYFLPGGTEVWYRHGEMHREGGPASFHVNGNGDVSYEGWYKNGIRHRIGGPAERFRTGTEKWLVNGEMHRIDGPALTMCFEDPLSLPICVWYVDGLQISKEAFKKRFFDDRSSKIVKRYS